MKLVHNFSPEFLEDVRNKGELVHYKEIPIVLVRRVLQREGVESRIGVQGLANILSRVLNLDIEYSPGWVEVRPGEQLIWALYKGPPLDDDQETVLPKGRLKFFGVTSINVPSFMPTIETRSFNHMSLE